MQLNIGKFNVRDIQLGKKTILEKEILTVNKTELLSVIHDESVFKSMDVEVVKPNENTRIIHVLDSIQPRIKLSGLHAFPGMTGKVYSAGTGTTFCLDDTAVIVSCEREKGIGNIVHESMIDMTGPGAEFNLFASLNNIVIICEAVEGLGDAEFGKATRLVGLKAAEYLAKASLTLEPDQLEKYTLQTDAEGLPKVAYIYLVQSQGYLRQTFVYGADMNGSLPAVLHPNEVMDGAVVSGNYVIGAQKNPTYLHVNNPVISSLYDKHGKELDFVGVIISNEHSLLEEKERGGMMAAKQAKLLGADGVIITKEGGGNTYTDLMVTCRECEKLGIHTVIITNEVSGPDGDQPPLVDMTIEANAIVSTGNMDEMIELPKVNKVIGKSNTGSEGESFSTNLGRLYTRTNPLGNYTLTAIET
ncbi:glycine/sarcosine/betaine reductase component B subunit [Siminovitchia sediminis]|uniref:Glycine/sarcosine/betaine reductase component B subunit n=1 Tax=Siminovitchia sediminis TaxID=1274353 RepID=A0ABW4KK50_9BACI